MKFDKENVAVEENKVEETIEVLDEKDVVIKDLQDVINKLNSELENVKRAAADAMNRSKQVEIDKKYAASDIARKLLVPLSYFEGALKIQSDDANFNNFLKGFEMIYNLILDQLFSEGLKEISVKINDNFDPYIHEVTELVEVDEGESEKVLEVSQKGFYFKDRVIQPTKVKVSKLKIEKNQNEENTEKVLVN